jgi:hypothetical protein
VLKPAAKKRLVKTEDFYVSCDFNDNWSVPLSRTVVVGYGGDPWEIGGSDFQSEAPSRDALTRDSIQHLCAWETFKEAVRQMQKDLYKKTC